jgi:transposase
MQGKKHLTPKLFVSVNLLDLVPKDNFYRRLMTTLDLQFLREATRPYYGQEGQQSIDPIVFFKILLVGYINNINSDRQLIAYCSDSLSIRLFLGYDIDESLPWHSTISRTRQLYGEEVFLDLFKRVLGMCIAKGMVRGKRQAVDSAFIKANASLDSLVEKEILDDVSNYADELNEGSDYKVSSTRKKLVERHHKWKEEAYKNKPGGKNISGHSNKIEAPIDENGNLIRPRYLSNHTHYSPTDPDARISVKPGKARQMNYYGQICVDDGHHVITAACADFADKRDSQCLENLIEQSRQNLAENQMPIGDILADAGYSSGESLKYLDDHRIEAWMPNFGQYIPERPGFVYNKEANHYQCIKEGGHGAILTYKGERTDSKGYTKRTYRSSETDCRTCPLREQCCGKKTKFKKIDDSIHKELYDKMHQKLKSNPRTAKKMSKIRSKTVEPVLGTLLNFRNMRRVNTRGIKQTNKHVLMSALTYNLLKYLNFNKKKTMSAIQAMSAPFNNGLQTIKTAFLSLIQSITASIMTSGPQSGFYFTTAL